MKAVLNSLRRFSLTGLVALVALWAGYKLWDYYMNEPWTVTATFAPTWCRLLPMFRASLPRCWSGTTSRSSAGTCCSGSTARGIEIALKQAEAVLLGKAPMLDEANADLKRYSALTPGVVVSKQRMDQVVAVQGSAQAAYDQAVADLAPCQAQPRSQRGARLRQWRRHQHGVAPRDLSDCPARA